MSISPILRVVREMPAAEVAALFSSPVTLLAGTPGYFIHPLMFAFFKNGVSPYTLASQNLQLKSEYNNGTLCQFGINPVLESTEASAGAYQEPAIVASIAELPNGRGGADVTLNLATADATVNGDDCTAVLYYQLLPNTADAFKGLLI